jgi:hypothetical protein
MFGLKRRRRQRLRQRPVPPEWLAIIRRKVRYYDLLSPEEREELLGHTQVFLGEKRFEGCGGLEITDEIRLTIAVLACLLLLNRQTDYYAKLPSILVYPHGYLVDAAERLPAGIVAEGVQARRGESWYRGPVVLSWDDVQRDAADFCDGHNVVLHEFAHQLDSESGALEGTPALAQRSLYVTWERVLGSEYRRLVNDLEHHRGVLLPAYGATSPAEFFAVATETFFEQPLALRRRHPELYEQLQTFYAQDPAARFERTGHQFA